MPTDITSTLHFRTLLRGHKYLVADFYATWCPPCKAIAPLYDQLSKSNSLPGKLEFVKINVDEQPELAAQYGITAIPTFLVFKDGQKADEVRSANANALKKAVEKARDDLKSAEAQTPAAEARKEEERNAVVEEKTVSGSYGMTGGSNWKTSLN